VASSATEAPAVYVLTGVMASGKSTVAEAYAHRFEHAVHLRGDVFRKMIVTGRDPIAPELGDEALRQLRLRYRLAAASAVAYWQEGYTVVLQDVVLGELLVELIDAIAATPLYLIVLTPRPEVVADRERARGKHGYVDGWRPEDLCAALESTTPRLGLWLDTSDLTVEATVEQLLERRDEARVR
jgi:predicted kinase